MASSQGQRIAMLAHAASSPAEGTNFSEIISNNSNSSNSFKNNNNSSSKSFGDNDDNNDDDDDDNDIRSGFENMLSLHHYTGSLQLMIRVARAYDLVNKATFGKQHPMLRISVGGKVTTTEKQIGAGSNASFSDKFSFSFRASDYRNGMKISFQVLIHNVLGMETSLGSFEQPLKDFISVLNKARRITMLLSPNGGYLTMKSKLANLSPLPQLTTEMIKSTDVTVATQVFLLLRSIKSEEKDQKNKRQTTATEIEEGAGGGGAGAGARSPNTTEDNDDDDFDLGDIDYEVNGLERQESSFTPPKQQVRQDGGADGRQNQAYSSSENATIAPEEIATVEPEEIASPESDKAISSDVVMSSLISPPSRLLPPQSPPLVTLGQVLADSKKSPNDDDDDGGSTSYDVPHLPFFETFFAVRGEQMKPKPKPRTKIPMRKKNRKDGGGDEDDDDDIFRFDPSRPIVNLASLSKDYANEAKKKSSSSPSAPSTAATADIAITSGDGDIISGIGSSSSSSSSSGGVLSLSPNDSSRLANEGTSDANTVPEARVGSESPLTLDDDDDDDEFGLGDVQYEAKNDPEDDSNGGVNKISHGDSHVIDAEVIDDADDDEFEFGAPELGDILSNLQFRSIDDNDEGDDNEVKDDDEDEDAVDEEEKEINLGEDGSGGVEGKGVGEEEEGIELDDDDDDFEIGEINYAAPTPSVSTIRIQQTIASIRLLIAEIQADSEALIGDTKLSISQCVEKLSEAKLKYTRAKRALVEIRNSFKSDADADMLEVFQVEIRMITRDFIRVAKIYLEISSEFAGLMSDSKATVRRNISKRSSSSSSNSSSSINDVDGINTVMNDSSAEGGDSQADMATLIASSSSTTTTTSTTIDPQPQSRDVVNGDDSIKGNAVVKGNTDDNAIVNDGDNHDDDDDDDDDFVIGEVDFDMESPDNSPPPSDDES